jgi:glycerol uptake facilitator-like aquaporin
MSFSINYFAALLVLGPVIGGFFNPAVATGIFVKEFYDGVHDFRLYFMRILSQIVGAIFGALIITATTLENIAILCPPPTAL